MSTTSPMIVAFGTGHTHGSFRVGKHKHATSLPRAKRDDLEYDVDDDDEFPAGMSYRSTSTAAAGGSQWAVQEADITMSPTARAAATARPVATNPGRWADEDDRDTGFDDRNSNSRDDRWQHDETDNGWSERAAGESRERERGAQSRNPRAYGDTSGYERNGDGGNFNGDTQNKNQTGGTPSWQNEDIIADSGQDWFENDEDWYEPEYGSVDAPAGSILEKVQRVHLREPKDYTFPDGEYFDLTGFVKVRIVLGLFQIRGHDVYSPSLTVSSALLVTFTSTGNCYVLYKSPNSTPVRLELLPAELTLFFC